MEHSQHLGESDLGVPRLGVGAMTWGAARGMARLYPAKMAYGGAHGYEEERRALEVSLEAGVNLLEKPFSEAVLLAAVREVLDA